jgi:HAD superfamily hydrolase (TIGR01509 family)
MNEQNKDESTLFLRKHWIFDLDGTLTLPVHDFDTIRADLGIPEGSDILGWLDALPTETARPLFQRLDEIEAEVADSAQAAPGAVDLLQALHTQGYRLGILTRNLRTIAQRCLSTLGVMEAFDPQSILGREEAKPKPDPDGILKLLHHWGASATDSLIVGDYRYDLLAGRAAGIATIHVDHHKDYAWPESSDLCVESLCVVDREIRSLAS